MSIGEECTKDRMGKTRQGARGCEPSSISQTHISRSLSVAVNKAIKKIDNNFSMLLFIYINNLPTNYGSIDAVRCPVCAVCTPGVRHSFEFWRKQQRWGREGKGVSLRAACLLLTTKNFARTTDRFLAPRVLLLLLLPFFYQIKFTFKVSGDQRSFCW